MEPTSSSATSSLKRETRCTSFCASGEVPKATATHSIFRAADEQGGEGGFVKLARACLEMHKFIAFMISQSLETSVWSVMHPVSSLWAQLIRQPLARDGYRRYRGWGRAGRDEAEFVDIGDSLSCIFVDLLILKVKM